jgi:hypothetical protein
LFDLVSLVDWWHSYGGRAIELQRFARHVVSLCASSYGCEQNWSKFESMSISSFACYPYQYFSKHFIHFGVAIVFLVLQIQRKGIDCCIRG